MSSILKNECRDEILIKEQWYNLISGKEVDNKIIPGFILESWKRSLKNQINPSSLRDVLLTKREVENEINKLEELVLEFGDIINVIRELSRNKNWHIQIFDKNCKNLYCILDNFNSDLSKLIASDVSEEKIGTNSINIVIREETPVQIRGPEHFNELLHDVYCSAAPIFNKKKELIAVINIASINKKHNKETISLVTSFAKVFTNKLIIKEMNKELRVYNNTLNKIIKYYPEGILFIDSNNKIKNYNDKLLEILEIEDKEIEDEKKSIDKIIKKFNILNSEDFDNKDVILDIKKRRISILITSKKISDNKYGVEGNIVTFKKTDDIYRLSNDIKNKSVYFSFDDIIGESNEIKNIIELAKRISKTNASVLIKGESGTGKEVFAQAIHSYSNRSKNHFVPINCGAIPADLIESELFGYEPGSFTGGLKNGKIGKLEHASGGTIFFDEIDSMPINLQIKLLRALSSKKITRIGGKDEIHIDIRIISATKKDLFYEIKNECFREDFYYRINTILLEIPPLRERNKDICILTKYFVKYYEKIYNVKIRKITKDYIKALEKYYFNGNVRELRHIIERSVILAKNYILDINVLPQQIFDNKSKNNILEYNNPNKQSVLDLHEKELIKKVLEKENYNISSSSRILGISRPTLYNKIKEYDISVK